MFFFGAFEGLKTWSFGYVTIFYHFSPMCYPPNVTWHFVFVKCMLHMIFSYASMNKLIIVLGKIICA